MTQTTTNITGNVKLGADGDQEVLDFTGWLYHQLDRQIALDPDQDDRVFSGNHGKGDKNFYLWSWAEEERVRESQGSAFSLDHFVHSHHLHLYRNNDGGNIGIVFTHKVEHRGSDLGDLGKIRESQKEAKKLSAVKHHPGGRSDVNSDCLLVSPMDVGEIGVIWSDAPQWQVDLVGVLRRFIGSELHKVQKDKGFTSWWDQWVEVFRK